MAKFCSNCGNEINDTDKHCSSCGAKVNTITLDSITDFIDEKKDRLEKRINSDFIEPTMNAELKEHVKDRGITENFFKKDGRLNRKRYIKRYIAINLLRAILVLFLLTVLSDEYGNMSMLNNILLTLVIGVIIYSNFCINLRREQDIAKFENIKMVTETVKTDEGEEEREVEKDTSGVGLCFLIAIIDFIGIVVNFFDINLAKILVASKKTAILIPFLPIIGPLLVIIVYLYIFYLAYKKGTVGPNQYGPDPLEVHKDKL